MWYRTQRMSATVKYPEISYCIVMKCFSSLLVMFVHCFCFKYTFSNVNIPIQYFYCVYMVHIFISPLLSTLLYLYKHQIIEFNYFYSVGQFLSFNWAI